MDASSSVPRNSVKEGKAQITLPDNIFYNPVQEYNRDLSVAALTVFLDLYGSKLYSRSSTKRKIPTNDDVVDNKEEFTIVEALAASGLRSIRYALEVPKLHKIYANDCSSKAVETITHNAMINNVEDKVIPVNTDAIWFMQKLRFENQQIHAIDIDPYGSPVQFLDSAIGCIADGGMLMITCTDVAVMAGNVPETCYVKYGSISLRIPACHEMALRIALHSVASHCATYGKYIVPLLSISADFYLRIFVRIFSGQRICKTTASKLSMVFTCKGCGTLAFQPLCTLTKTEKGSKYSLPLAPGVSDCCTQCGSKYKMGGPIWTGELHDDEFLDKMCDFLSKDSVDCVLNTKPRMYGMLSLIKDELKDVPLFYTVDGLCSKLHCQMIPLVNFRSALVNAGYEVSLSHCKTNSIKTNAPVDVIWDILRCWVKDNPVSEKRLATDAIASAILKKEPKISADFSVCDKGTFRTGLVRYQMNPLPYWGPGCKSKANILSKLDDKSEECDVENEATNQSFNGKIDS